MCCFPVQYFIFIIYPVWYIWLSAILCCWVLFLIKCDSPLLLFLHCSEILLYTVRLIRNLAFELEQSHRLLNHFQQWLRLPFKHWINLEMTSSSEVQCTWKSLMSSFSWTVILFSVMSPGERNASGISSKTCVYLYAVANILFITIQISFSG